MENNIVVYTVKEVATMLHTSPNTVYDLIYTGKLKAIKIKSIKILSISLIEFLTKYNGKDVDEVDTIVNINGGNENV